MYFTEANIPASLNPTGTGKLYRVSTDYIKLLHYNYKGEHASPL